MLAVGVDGVDEVVVTDLSGGEPLAQVGEGEVVGRRHAPVVVEGQHPRVVLLRKPLLDDLTGVVGGAVVHHDELVDQRVEPFEDALDRRFLVVGGDDGNAPRQCPIRPWSRLVAWLLVHFDLPWRVPG